MTLLHQAAQKAVEALTELADAGAEAWSEDRPCQKQARAAITALQAALQQQLEPVAPTFASAVARRKWESLQADGYRMQRIHFARSVDGHERRGTIDPWGKVLWEPDGVPACRALQLIPSEWSCDCVEPGPGCRPTGIRRPHGVMASVSETKTPSGTDGGPHPLPAQANDGGEHG